jgi:uncharacterized protein (TIGR00255 family)
MIKSMTGFGRAIAETPTLNIAVELKTLNSKSLDVFCRLPRSYSEREIEIRNLLTQRLERGKVDFNLTINSVGTAGANTVLNRPLVNSYFTDLQQTALNLGFEPDPNQLLRSALLMPNVYTTDLPNEEAQNKEWADILSVITTAIVKCNEFRHQEGLSLKKAFEDSLAQIGNLLMQIENLDEKRIPAVRERLEKAVKELVSNDNFDPNRLEQELIFYAEKYDISEEKVRLKNHIKYFIETVSSNESNGKKLNFIAQEIGREINTIGSKANDAAIQHLVVQMKDELEKIKEQTANVI